jgi:hypothetical protein
MKDINQKQNHHPRYLCNWIKMQAQATLLHTTPLWFVMQPYSHASNSIWPAPNANAHDYHRRLCRNLETPVGSKMQNAKEKFQS